MPEPEWLLPDGPFARVVDPPQEPEREEDDFGVTCCGCAVVPVGVPSDDLRLTVPVDKIYSWDGTNKYGDACASGVYILYLIEPFDRKVKRILLVR